MNNEREFVDLAKAVNEQRAKRAATVPVASKKVGGAKRGRYMDMVVRQTRVQQERPPTRDYGVGKTIVAPKPEAKSAPKQTNGPRIMGRDIEPVRRTPAPAPKPTETISPKKPEPEQPKTPFIEDLIEEVNETPRPNLFSEENAQDDKSPDANNYSLGGRSPFMLADAKVDKRPLGPNVPESNAGAIRSTKNVYSQRTPLKAGADEMPGRSVITVAAPKKNSGWLWALLTLGIIVAGGGIGLLAFAIFAPK